MLKSFGINAIRYEKIMIEQLTWWYFRWCKSKRLIMNCDSAEIRQFHAKLYNYCARKALKSIVLSGDFCGDIAAGYGLLLLIIFL